MITVNYIDTPIDVDINNINDNPDVQIGYNDAPIQVTVDTVDLVSNADVTVSEINANATVEYNDNHITVNILEAPSGSSVDYNDYYVAVANVNGNKLVMLDNGGVRHFDNTIENNYNKAIGFSVNSAIAGEIVIVKRFGKMDSFGSLVPTDTYYAGENGGITNVIPTDGRLFVEVGNAVTPSILDIKLNHELVTI